MARGKFQTWIVVKLNGQVILPARDETQIERWFFENHIISWNILAGKFPGIGVNRLFHSINPDTMMKLTAEASKHDPAYRIPDFFAYYLIGCPAGILARELLPHLLSSSMVEFAYLQNDPIPLPSSGSPTLPGHVQGYLHPAPLGIDAGYAWQIKAGDGSGKVQFADIEQGWVSHHESVTVNRLSCTGINHYFYEDHGIAVLGIIAMQNSGKGLSGITPGANGYVVSQWRPGGSLNTADAIMAAVEYLQPGDIILLEAQAIDISTSSKVWPIETQEAVWQVIRLATALGIIVIEPAGNGTLGGTKGNDLDDYSSAGRKILNPESPGFRDSGAIFVAAATAEVPHARMGYSNYGKRVNCYAWGERIATAGNHPGSSGIAVNTYTGSFGGTSGASAIIAGAAIAVQSVMEANRNTRFNPAQMRHLLSAERFNTPSKNGHTADKIGVMPDLRNCIAHALKQVEL